MLGTQVHSLFCATAGLCGPRRCLAARQRTLPRRNRGLKSLPACSANLRAEVASGDLSVTGDVRTLRRSFLSFLAVAAAASVEQARAADPPPEEDNPLGMGQPVRPALSARAYLDKIAEQKGPALGLLRQLVDDEDYGRLANSLVLGPYDDLRQSCYYLPWVVVRTDEKLGTDMELAYVEIRESMIALDSEALAADRYEADQIEVKAALSRLEEAYSRFFALAAKVVA